jgi:hypothetical protein
MIRTDAVVASSHLVKIALATCAISAVPAVLGFQLFASHLGQTSRGVVDAATCQDDSCVPTTAVQRTVADLEDHGLVCRSRPGLTDRVVFERKTTEVAVIDFASAIRASSIGEGWVRSYCMAAP